MPNGINRFTSLTFRPLFLSWALVAALLFAQSAGSAHKAQLDGHDAGQLCHACVLFDRQDVAPPATAFSLPEPDLAPTPPTASPATSAVATVRITPPSRAPPRLIV